MALELSDYAQALALLEGLEKKLAEALASNIGHHRAEAQLHGGKRRRGCTLLCSTVECVRSYEGSDGLVSSQSAEAGASGNRSGDCACPKARGPGRHRSSPAASSVLRKKRVSATLRLSIGVSLRATHPTLRDGQAAAARLEVLDPKQRADR